MNDRTSLGADYALASIKHWTNLLKICQKEQTQALKMLDDLYQTYKKYVEYQPASPFQLKSMLREWILTTTINN